MSVSERLRSLRTAGSALWFWGAAALAVLLHADLVFSREGLWGGGDLIAHLRLIELTAADGGLHNTYAPAYHLLGAALAPVLGVALYARLFAFASAVLLIAGFRSFQRAAGLPDASAAFFCLTPFVLSLSWCTPRIEAAGYALVLFGLSLLLRRRYVLLAAALALTFSVHTASALLFGISGGVLALARRDLRGLLALACGSLGALPLVIGHLADGCSIAEAFLFSGGGYQRSPRGPVLPRSGLWPLLLINPIGLGAAAWGARRTWQADRPVALLCVAWLVLYLNNLWLAPFEVRTLLTLHRGLSLLAIPVAIAAGFAAASRPRVGAALVLATALLAASAPFWLVQKACFVGPIRIEGVERVAVERCAFIWRGGRAARPPDWRRGARAR